MSLPEAELGGAAEEPLLDRLLYAQLCVEDLLSELKDLSGIQGLSEANRSMLSACVEAVTEVGGALEALDDEHEGAGETTDDAPGEVALP